MRRKKYGKAKRLAAVIMSAALMITGLPQSSQAYSVLAAESSESGAYDEDEFQMTEQSLENKEDISKEESSEATAVEDTQSEVSETKATEDETSEIETEVTETQTPETEQSETEEIEEIEKISVPIPNVDTSVYVHEDRETEAGEDKINVLSSAQYTFTEAPTQNQDGTYSIDSKDQFTSFLADKDSYNNKTIVLNCDIDMAGELTEFAAKFMGTFDGNGHSINNITVSEGLFKSIRSGAEVKNLHISGVSFKGDNSAGIVTAENNGTISNVSVIGNLETTYTMERAGGIAGRNGGTIQNCIYYGTITASSDTNGYGVYIGGITGENTGKIEASYAAGNIITNANCVAGIAARNSKDISNCASYMNIEGASEIGGIVAESEGGTISDCTNYGTVTQKDGNQDAGGIAAKNSAASTIQNSYNYGTIKGDGNNIGGIAGYNAKKITNCGNYGDVSGFANVGGITGLNLSTAQAEISKCFNTGKITGLGTTSAAQGIGGILGSSSDEYNVKISGCYNTGSISVTSSTSYIGGIAGIIKKGTISDSYITASFAGVTAPTETVNQYAGMVAGFMGNAENASFSNTYYLSEVLTAAAYRESGAVIDENAPKSSDEIKALAGTLGSDFAADSDNINNGYPIIAGQTLAVRKYPVVYELNGGSASYYYDITDNAVQPTAPTKKNAVFDGWYTDASLENAYSWGGVGSPVVLYAKWSSYTVAEKIELTTSSIRLVKGKTYDISVKCTPEEAKTPEIAWSSDNTNVATVDGTGKVTAVSNGSANITGKVTDGTLNTTLELKVYVGDTAINFKNADTNEFIDTLYVAVGEDNAAYISIDLDEDTLSKAADDVQWSSNQEAYVTCVGVGTSLKGNRAKVTGIKPTSDTTAAVVTAVVLDKSGNLLATGQLTVYVLPQATSVNIMIGTENATDKYAFYDIKTKKFLSIGTSRDASIGNTPLSTPADSIEARILPSDAIQTVEWTTDNEAVMKVDKTTGAIEGNSSGEAVITASAKDGSDKTGKVTVVSRIMVSELSFEALTADKSEAAPADEHGRVMLTSGNSVRLVPKFVPAEATVKNIEIVNGNSNAIDITADTATGEYIVTAKTVTEDTVVKITGTTRDGAHAEGSINLIIKPKVTKINIYKDNDLQNSFTDRTIGINPEKDSKVFTLRVKNEPENASQLVSWKSGNTKVATVEDNNDGSCVVTVLDKGSAVITATATDGSNVSAVTTINVSTTAAEIVITGSNSVVKGGTVTLKAEVYPKTAQNRTVKWSSLMPEKASVNETTGEVIGKSAGIAIIIATAQDGSGVTGSHTIKVTDQIKTFDIIKYDGNNNDDDDVILSDKSVGIDPDIYDDGVDPTTRVDMRITPETACQTVTWKSSNEKVATVKDGVITAVAMGTAVVTATSDDGSGKTAQVKVMVTTLTKSVKITGEHYVGKNCSIQLKAVVGDLDAANKNVVWTSQYPKIATVDSTGKVTAVGSDGWTVITAEAADGSGAKAEHKIYVLGAKDTVDITSTDGALNIQEKNKTKTADYDMSDKDTVKLKATLTGGASEEEYQKGVTWTTSDKNIATAEADNDTKSATVTFLKAGKVTITATAADGTGVRDRVTVTVANPNPKVTITGPKQVASGKKIMLSSGNTDVTWESLNESIAKINDKGQVSAQKTTGEVTIKATAVSGVENPHTDLYTVTVAPAVTRVDIKVNGVTVTGKKVGMDIINGYNGNQLDLDAAVTGIVNNADVNDDRYVTWKSSNEQIATVDEDGKITPKKSGTVKITATATDGSNKKSTVSVVIGKQVTRITPQNDEVKVAYRKSVQLAVNFKPMAASNKNVTWASSSPDIVSVSKKGVVKAKNYAGGDGYVTITATAADGSGASCEFKVYVTNPSNKLVIKKAGEEPSAVAGIDLDTADGKIKLDTDITDKNLNMLEGQSVTWKTSNKSIATVDENGEVTGLQIGKVTITATAGDGTKKSGKVTLYVGKLVTGITISSDMPEVLTIQKGKKQDISSYITITPITATYQTLSYTTSDKSVATVDKKGKITGKKAGTAQITISTTDGSNISRTINVRVY
jgi:uncharacterized protein YjdB